MTYESEELKRVFIVKYADSCEFIGCTAHGVSAANMALNTARDLMADFDYSESEYQELKDSYEYLRAELCCAVLDGGEFYLSNESEHLIKIIVLYISRNVELEESI